MENTTTTTRAISSIAYEIKRLWRPVHPFAAPYLDAMTCVESMNDQYIMEDGRTQVIYFLANATMWRGPDARRIKAELNAMLKKR